jgi:NTE family protein
MHRLRHIINELAAHLPPEELKNARVALLKSYGCVTTMHVVRLVAPQIEGEDHTKDIDFSREGIRQRRLAGLEHTRRVLAEAPWNGAFDPMEGFILHEVECGDVTRSA